jgi:predicted RNA binding protein YcfA (HicA-like mRNA interferase family)
LKLPRDLSGEKLARLLSRFDYKIARQTGSHMRLTSNFKGTEHNITIPAHKLFKIGTLSSILADVSLYLELSRDELAKRLFSR